MIGPAPGNGNGRGGAVPGRETTAFEVITAGFLVLLILLPPLAYGSVAPWAKQIVFAASLLLFSLWLLQAAFEGRLAVKKTPAWWFILFLLAVAGLQLLPLPEAVLRVLSPAARDLYSGTLDLYDGGRGLSVSPYDTRSAFLRVLALAALFFAVVNSVRHRWQVTVLMTALVALGVFESLYGFADEISGSRSIFWNERASAYKIAGTFHNRNNFSGLLEMIVPVTLGWLLALNRGGGEGGGKRFLLHLRSSRTYQQAVLAGAALTMVLAVLFSLSRTGIAITALTLLGTAAMIGRRKGHRKGALIILCVAAGSLLVGHRLGLDKVTYAMGEALSGRSESALHRVEMSRSGLRIVRDFPLFGTGLGTTRAVFPKYQPRHLGDSWASHIHNDWLQLLMETGLIAGTVSIAGLLLFLLSLLRFLRRRRSSYHRFLAAGMMMGLGALILHGFVDHNLGKMTSHSVIFAVIAGLAFLTVRAPSPGRGERPGGQWQFELASRGARGTVALLAVLVAAGGLAVAAPRFLADISANRSLAMDGGLPDGYFFLPLPPPGGDGGPLLERALGLDGSNPRLHYYAALRDVGRAEELVRARAVEVARGILGEEIAESDPESLARIADALSWQLKWKTGGERDVLLAAAERSLRRAVASSPAVAAYHLMLAKVLDEGGTGGGSRSLAEVERARRLAPEVPWVQYAAAQICLSLALRSGGDEREVLKETAVEGLRKATQVDPSYAPEAYALARGLSGWGLDLGDFVYPSLPAAESLYDIHVEEGDWEGALATLTRIEALAGRDRGGGGETAGTASAARLPDDEAGEERSRRAAEARVRYDAGNEAEVRLSVEGRRVFLLGVLGRWRERSAAKEDYRRLLRVKSEAALEGARKLRGRGRIPEALRVCTGILREDWAFPEALIEAAEMATLPQVRGAAGNEGPAAHLFRLVLYNDSLDPGVAAKARKILAGIDFADRDGRMTAELTLGAAEVLAGRIDEGQERLRRLVEGRDAATSPWSRGHLPWYFLAVGFERKGMKDEAREAYGRVLAEVPLHLPSLLRLEALGEDVGRTLASLRPAVGLNVDFGGKVRLLGYSLQGGAPGGGRGRGLPGRSIRYFWEFIDRFDPPYWTSFHFGEGRGEPAVAQDHVILRGGKPYPVGEARSGEVVMEELPLPGEGPPGRYLSFSAGTSAAEFYHDAGLGRVVRPLALP